MWFGFVKQEDNALPQSLWLLRVESAYSLSGFGDAFFSSNSIEIMLRGSLRASFIIFSRVIVPGAGFFAYLVNVIKKSSFFYCFVREFDLPIICSPVQFSSLVEFFFVVAI